MPHILKNNNLEVHIDLPNKNYNFSRFDWTGKIIAVKFKNVFVSTNENNDNENEHLYGKAFYNEFGIDNALGFDDTEIGGWFHKIGIGLLKKDNNDYQFIKKYQIKPAKFKTTIEHNCLINSCVSEYINGYSYELTKKIELHETSFIIKYSLKNTGEKNIITDEYVHNFTSINNDLLGPNYKLEFPFELNSKLFNEYVNPEEKLDIKKNIIVFNSTPTTPFFFSNLSGGKEVEAKWELLNQAYNITINEVTSFKTTKVNLWGCGHVVSPELFFNIFLKPGETNNWSRTYYVNKTGN
ncbi:hypothetical protein [Hyunsoonleella aestuarii]|uniref:DUF4432 family protein n=1 Tax=Hyunsoonleella aestuarii TaxID=912802 RepID=A0ABP8E9P7_9FLAO|nr:hypothetical protein [Hyunsoonleella aestuarii]